jgi:hypothetical protein
VPELDEVPIQGRHIHIAGGSVGEGHKPNHVVILSRLHFANAISKDAIGS